MTVIAAVKVKLSDAELKRMSKVWIVYEVLMLNVVKGGELQVTQGNKQ